MIVSTNASNIGGTIGSDTKPVKIVNGQVVEVTDTLAKLTDIPTVPRFVSGHTGNVSMSPGTGSAINISFGITYNQTPIVSAIPDGLPPGVEGIVYSITAVTNSGMQISWYNVGPNTCTLSFYYTASGY